MSSWLESKFVSVSKQWEVYLWYELVEKYGFINYDIIWKWIDENLEIDVESVINGTGKQPSIEQ